MRFLVYGEFTEPGPLLPPDQLSQLLDQAIVPSLEMIATWEDEGKCTGGVYAGERAGTFILEAASSEEVGQLLASLPFWGVVTWEVRPLQSWRSAAERETGVAQQIKSAMQQ